MTAAAVILVFFPPGQGMREVYGCNSRMSPVMGGILIQKGDSDETEDMSYMRLGDEEGNQ